jgi:hypothetical protein
MLNVSIVNKMHNVMSCGEEVIDFYILNYIHIHIYIYYISFIIYIL